MVHFPLGLDADGLQAKLSEVVTAEASLAADRGPRGPRCLRLDYGSAGDGDGLGDVGEVVAHVLRR